MRLPTRGSLSRLATNLVFLLLSFSLIHPVSARALSPRARVAGSSQQRNDDNNNNNNVGPPQPPPRHFGVMLPRAFSVLDVFGPVEVFQALSRFTQLELSMVARTREPVTTALVNGSMNRFNSSFASSVVPTHAFDDDPPIDVLIVPGGAAARSPDLAPEVEYIRRVFPRLQYLITICTGAGIAAQSGVLDGHRATTNKAAWETMRAMGPEVKWVSPARWVEDGKVWSSSGVTAGIDLAFAFIKAKYPNGTAIAEQISGIVEHTIVEDWRDDPWSEKFNIPPSN